MAGDHQIGITVTTLSKELDEGSIIAQKKIPITDHDVSDPLRTKLFEIGADLLVQTLADYVSGKIKGTKQHESDTPFSQRLTREDGFEAWENIQNAFEDPAESSRIERKFRALAPWPGVWTLYTISGEQKRLKLMAVHLNSGKLMIDSVQLEGKNPVSFEQFQNAYQSQ